MGTLVSGDILKIDLQFTEDTAAAPFKFKIALYGPSATFTIVPDANQPTGFLAADEYTIAPALSFSWTFSTTLTGQHYVQVWET